MTSGVGSGVAEGAAALATAALDGAALGAWVAVVPEQAVTTMATCLPGQQGPADLIGI